MAKRNRMSKKAKGSSSKPIPGFFPCFAKYDRKMYPLGDIYAYHSSSNIKRVKALLSAFVDSQNPMHLKNNIGQEIKMIKPNSSEANAIIRRISSACDWQDKVYRIDYGNTKFRVLFGLSNEQRMVFVFGFDVYHKTFG